MSEQCQAVVYKRDTYRYTGGKRRYEMHYTKCACKRAPVEGGLCWQHAKLKRQGRYVSTWN